MRRSGGASLRRCGSTARAALVVVRVGLVLVAAVRVVVSPEIALPMTMTVPRIAGMVMVVRVRMLMPVAVRVGVGVCVARPVGVGVLMLVIVGVLVFVLVGVLVLAFHYSFSP